MFKIVPFSPKLLSCPVFVHLAQFSYIDKTTFLRENARRKLMCQPPCCVLIVFSLRFVNKYRLSDQCLVYKANGYSGGGCLINPAVSNFLVPHFWAAFLTLNPPSRTSFTALIEVVDRLPFCVLQLLRKGLYEIRSFPSVSAYAFRLAHVLRPFPLTVAFLSYFCKCLLEWQRSEKKSVKPVN